MSIDNDKFKAHTADLELFNQLLQMVDGDWSDSIQGICDHIQKKFRALAVFLSVFDKQYKEHIYVCSALDGTVSAALVENGIGLSQALYLLSFKKVHELEPRILRKRVFRDDELIRIAGAFFIGKTELSNKMVKQISVQTLFAIPVLARNSNYECTFHILSRRYEVSREERLIKKYQKQLNVALEIIFLVRDLYIRATHDGLTKLFNHKQGIIQLEQEMNRVERTSEPLTIAMVDIDHFKQINDTHGHLAGDAVLEFAAAYLNAALRKCDVSSRFGGEEFLVILPNTALEAGAEVMSRVKDEFARHTFRSRASEFRVTASFGLAQFDQRKHHSANELIEAADQKLYEAKHSGRNSVRY